MLTARWHDESNYLIVLAALNELALVDIIASAHQRGMVYTIFREPDLDNEITAVVLEPGRRARRLCANLPLALREREGAPV